jgi:DNA/RNA-binding domain of Phe-tRNA-synthetase-like protein
VTVDPVAIVVAQDVEAIVRPVAARVAPVRVVAHDPTLDGPLQEAADRLRGSIESADLTAAVRTMYRRIGIDPTKTRPSSEALLRRVRKGNALPRINSVVDVINWCSVETQLPFGLYDAARVDGAITMRLGHADEAYPGIRKDEVHVAGRLVVADNSGAFGNPTSDSLRTAVTESTTSVIVVIFVPASVNAEVGERALALTTGRLNRG